MAGELAPLKDGIPVVADDVAREQLFPLATRKQDQRVHRKDTGNIERWNGAEWEVEIIGSQTLTPVIDAAIPVVADDAARDAMFPPGTVPTNQRVQNLAAFAYQRFAGGQWVNEVLTTLRPAIDVRGDTDVILAVDDAPIQYFGTLLTTGRTVTLPPNPPIGLAFTIICDAPGTSSLNVGGVFTITVPATLTISYSSVGWIVVSYTERPAITIDPPVGFLYDPGLGITFFNGVYTTTFDAADYKVVGPVEYWVDPVNGNNNNPGTQVSPFRTISAALAAGDCDVMHLIAGVYPRQVAGSGTNALTLGSRSMSIIAEGGVAQICSHDVLSWTQVGVTSAYQATRSGVIAVWDSSIVDANGDYQELTLVGSAALVESTPGSWFTDGTTVYVHTSDSRPADDNIRCYLSVNVCTITPSTGPITIYMEGLQFEGRGVQMQNGGIGKELTAYVKNCTSKYTIRRLGGQDRDGWQFRGVNVYLQACEAARTGLDGFNYHAANGILCRASEIACLSRDTGLPGTTTNQPTTAHDGCLIVRLNGTYTRGHGPGICDVNPGTQSWNINCVSDANLSALSGPTNANFYIEDGDMWNDGCESGGGAIYDLSVNKASGTTPRMFIRQYRGGTSFFVASGGILEGY